MTPLLSKEQVSVAADQMLAEAVERRNRQALSRLESRFGPKPVGMTLDQFRERTVSAQHRLLRCWPFWASIVGYTALLAVPIIVHAPALAVAFIPLGALGVRLVSRRLTARFIREGTAGDGRLHTEDRTH